MLAMDYDVIIRPVKVWKHVVMMRVEGGGEEDIYRRISWRCFLLEGGSAGSTPFFSVGHISNFRGRCAGRELTIPQVCFVSSAYDYLSETISRIVWLLDQHLGVPGKLWTSFSSKVFDFPWPLLANRVLSCTNFFMRGKTIKTIKLQRF